MFIQVFLLCTNMKKCIPCIQGKKCHLRLQCLEMQYSFIPWGTRSYMTHQQISWSDASLFFRAVSIVSPITCIIFHMVRRLGETWCPCLISWCVQLFFFQWCSMKSLSQFSQHITQCRSVQGRHCFQSCPPTASKTTLIPTTCFFLTSQFVKTCLRP